MTLRSTFATLALAAALLTPATCFARDNAPPADEGPTMFSYGMRGLWTGAELGLAVGYLATGDHYNKGEWRKLVLGLGIGAIAGVGAGVSLAIVDASATRPRAGWFVLRDMGYGILLGALTGAAVGALFLVDSGRPKDILTGVAAGALVGAGVGVVFGVIEGLNSPHRQPDTARRNDRGVRITIAALPTDSRVPALVPALVGRF